MDQSAATARYIVESNQLDIIVALVIVVMLITAIVGSLALLMKRNESFITSVHISSDI
jgi:hypothetical protein